MHCFLDSGDLPFISNGMALAAGVRFESQMFLGAVLVDCEGEHLMCARVAQTPFQCTAFSTCGIYYSSVMNGVPAQLGCGLVVKIILTLGRVSLGWNYFDFHITTFSILFEGVLYEIHHGQIHMREYFFLQCVTVDGCRPLVRQATPVGVVSIKKRHRACKHAILRQEIQLHSGGSCGRTIYGAYPVVKCQPCSAATSHERVQCFQSQRGETKLGIGTVQAQA